MTGEPLYTLTPTDTDPHPSFRVYSAANFAEVAPRRLSPMSWSLLGPPVEQGTRAVVSRLLPSASWHTGSHFTFVGYFGHRPYHNLAAYCQIAELMPGVDPADVTHSYFDDQPPPAVNRGLGGTAARAAALPRVIREFASLRPRLRKVEGDVVKAEGEAQRALAQRGGVRLGAAVERTRALLPEAWELHYSTTLSVVPLRMLQRRLGERLTDHWAELEPWIGQPSELVWPSLFDASSTGGMMLGGSFLRRAFYEVADDHEPWAGYSVRAPVSDDRPETAARRDIEQIAWDLYPRIRVGLLPNVSAAAADAMTAREHSKSLAMRLLHVFRELVPRLAAEQGVAGDDWPWLTLDELLDAQDAGAVADVAAARREGSAAALGAQLPELLSFGPDGVALAPRRLPKRAALGVSAGIITGVAVDGALDGGNGEGPRVLVCESADADIQPLLPQVEGVVTARGSLLSHVAILTREYGIPAVVGHELARSIEPGQQVYLNGTTGEVRLLDT